MCGQYIITISVGVRLIRENIIRSLTTGKPYYYYDIVYCTGYHYRLFVFYRRDIPVTSQLVYFMI